MSLTAFFDRGHSMGADRIAFVKDDEHWTYGEARDLSVRVANGLIAQGVEPSTKCAVLAANDPKAWLCVIGAWRARLAWVPLNPRSPSADHIQLINGFNVEVLFFQKAFAPMVREIRDACPDLRLVVCLDGAESGALDFAAWSAAQDTTEPLRVSEENDLGAIMPTGGTTGAPKGVMLSQRNLTISIANGLLNTPYAPDEPIVNLAAAPMTHTAGFLSLSCTARGGTVVVMTKPEPEALLAAIEEHRVTEFFLPPTVIYRLLEMPGIEQRDFSSLRYFMYGAAPMSVEKLRLALGIFGPIMLQGYGQTEAPGSIAFLYPGDHFREGQIADDDRLSSCGRPCVLNSTAILDDAGKRLSAGETGEICVRGDVVMMGYYKQPDKTAETIVDGWLHTGDLGHIDREGFLHITDRKKDVIISGGFNVYPSEVEQVIWSHPAVLDCAVIGVPDDKWGEAVKAVVELKPGASIGEAELVALCKAQVGSVKAPKSVDFVASLPRSPVGKVLKKDIRNRYWKDAGRAI